jgi:hypothetical protein
MSIWVYLMWRVSGPWVSYIMGGFHMFLLPALKYGGRTFWAQENCAKTDTSEEKQWTMFMYCLQSTLGSQGRLPQRKTHECSGFPEFRTLKSLRLTYTACTIGLRIHKMTSGGVSYITVTKLLLYTWILHTKKLDLISCSLFQILWMLDSFFP